MSTILVINPNSSVSVTRRMGESLAPLIARSAHSVTCMELEQSPPGIETDEHVAQVIPNIAQAITRHPVDAYVIGCFSDPGIEHARTLTNRPVVGIAESAYLTAMALGKKFGIISLGPSSITRHARHLHRLGLSARLAGDRSIDTTVVEMMAGDVVETVLRTARRLRDEDGADVVILGCAGLGMHRTGLEAALGLPVVDPVQAGLILTCMQLDYYSAQSTS